MREDKVKVSIIMATYNRAHFIMESLQSIQLQTYENWECLIIDDGGNDNTQIVITPLLQQDKRFQFLKRPDTYKKGLPGCRNYGLDLAKGDYVIFFDDDDIVHPQNLELCIQGIKSGNYQFCHYKKQSFSDNVPVIEKQTLVIKKRLSDESMTDFVTQKQGIASCTVLWNIDCFDKIRFNENLLYAEEWECYCRIFLNGYEGVMLSNVLYYNRKHLESNTGEFWRGNKIRVESKKQAVLLVAKNLTNANFMTPEILKYLTGFAMDLRDYNLLIELLQVINIKRKKQYVVLMKYHLFPFWQFYERNKKSLNFRTI